MTTDNLSTETGSEKQINEQVTLDLLVKYQQLQDGPERLAVREAIIRELYPLVLSVVHTFVSPDKDLFNDVMQECLLKVTKALKSWSCTVKGTIGGYFRRTVANQCRTVLKKEGKVAAGTVSYDDPDYAFLRHMQTTIQDFTVIPIDPLFEGPKQQAYAYAVRWIIDMGFEDEGFGKLQRRLHKVYGISLRQASHVIDHARVTIRMEYVDRAPSVSLESMMESLPKDNLFRRMLPYLLDGELRDAVKIFTGIDIRIPRCN